MRRLTAETRRRAAPCHYTYLIVIWACSKTYTPYSNKQLLKNYNREKSMISYSNKRPFGNRIDFHSKL